MSDLRWRVRRNTRTIWTDDHAGAGHWRPKFVGEYGSVVTAAGTTPQYTIYGDTIAEVIDTISFHEGETP